MSLHIVHINKEDTELEANARKLAEVLRPKWEAKAKADAIKFCEKHKIEIPADWLKENSHA